MLVFASLGLVIAAFTCGWVDCWFRWLSWGCITHCLGGFLVVVGWLALAGLGGWVCCSGFRVLFGLLNSFHVLGLGAWCWLWF